MDSPSNRHIVKVMSQDRKQLFATLLAIPYYSNDRPPDDPQVRFMETPAANGVAATNAIKIWFYPGNTVGHEFIWPRDKAIALARATGVSVLTTKTDEESSDLTRVDASGVEAEASAESTVAVRTAARTDRRARDATRRTGTRSGTGAGSCAGTAPRPAAHGRRAAAACVNGTRLDGGQPYAAPRQPVVSTT
jgi:hypothetical protein